jgi:multiple sugar transport system permease protein
LNRAVRIPFFNKRKIQKRLTVLAFLSLWLIGFAVLFVYATGQTLFYSFTNFNLMNKLKWVGVGNYVHLLFSDSVFWESLGNTGFFIITVVPGIIILSFIFALLVKNKTGLTSFASVAYFLPFVIPLAATGLVWRWMFNGEYGIINFTLGLLGIPGPDWLTSSTWIKPGIAIAATTLIGQYFVIFVAALQDVPRELYEAADIDGASGLRKVFSVTIPMVSPAFYFNLVTCFIAVSQIFDLPYVITVSAGGQATVAGGPGWSSTSFVMYMYLKMFTEYDAGTASAMAMISLIIVLGISIGMIKASARFVSYDR